MQVVPIQFEKMQVSASARVQVEDVASVQLNKASVQVSNVQVEPVCKWTKQRSRAATVELHQKIHHVAFLFCISIFAFFYVLAFAFLLSCTRKFRHLSDGNEVGLNDTRGQLDCRGMAFALPRLCKTFLCWHSSFAKGSLPLFDPLCFRDTDARFALQVNQSKSEGKAWSSFCLSHFHVKLCFSPISCAWSGLLHGGL